MPRNPAAPPKVVLDGEWTMDEAVQHRELLTGEVGSLLQGEPRPERADIDMAGISSVDACGCQLLVVFLEHLKRNGIAARPCSLQPGTRDQILALGYAEAFALSGSTVEERA